MGTLVDKNTLRVMLLEILSKDKILLKEILQDLLAHDPQLLEEFTSTSQPMLVNDPPALYKAIGKNNQNAPKAEIDDAEIRILAQKQFEKYDTVFKALA